MIDEKKRIEWIDNLRALSCIAIIMIHVISGWLSSSINLEIDYSRWILDNVILQLFTRYAVPIFLMISGFLLLNPEKEITIYKIKKYILRMLLILFIFGLFFCLIENAININPQNIGDIKSIIIKSIFDLLQGQSWAHMWYIYMLIGIYILTPAIRVMIQYSDEKILKFLLITLFIFAFVVPTINNLLNLKITTFFLNSLILPYLFYFIVGYMIVNTNFEEKNIYKF